MTVEADRDQVRAGDYLRPARLAVISRLFRFRRILERIGAKIPDSAVDTEDGR